MQQVTALVGLKENNMKFRNFLASALPILFFSGQAFATSTGVSIPAAGGIDGIAGATDDCVKWSATGTLISAGAACGVAGGEPNRLGSPNVGTDIDLINSVPLSGVTLNLVSLAATDFSSAANIITIDDDSHAHTSTTISGIDISADTNLSATTPIELTGDVLSFANDATITGTVTISDVDPILCLVDTTDATAGCDLGITSIDIGTDSFNSFNAKKDGVVTSFLGLDGTGSGAVNIGNGTQVALINLTTVGATNASLVLPLNGVGETELDVTNAPTDSYALTYDGGTGRMTWEANAGGGGGAFSDAADPVVLVSTVKDVQIGDTGVSLTAKLEVSGDFDQPQLVVEGHTSQTDSVFIVQADDETQAFAVEANGNADFGGAVTATSFNADDRTIEPGNFISTNDNDTAFTNDPTCANSGTAGQMIIIDVDETAADNWQICNGTTIWYDIPNTSTDIIANTEIMVGSATAGTAAYVPMSGDATMDNLGAVLLADGVTVNNWALGTPASMTGTNINGTAANFTVGTATTANNLSADGVNAMLEIDAAIKRAADTDTHLLTTSAAIPGSNLCLEMDTAGSVVVAGGTCAGLGPGGTTTIDALGDAAGTGAVSLGTNAEYSQVWTWNLPLAEVADFDGLNLVFEHDSTSGDFTQNGLVIDRAAGAGTRPFESLMLLRNLSTSAAVTSGFKVTSANGTITTGVDVSDAQIGSAINIGLNTFNTQTGPITAVELDTLAGGILITELTAFSAGTLATATTDTATFYTEDTTVPVEDGGTGVATIPDGALVVGAVTGAVESVAAVATGSVLVSNGLGANPVWDTTPDLGTPSAIDISAATGSIALGTGTISGSVVTEFDTATNINTGLAITEFGGKWFFITSVAATITLPEITASGQSACFYSVTAINVTLDPSATDIIVLNGTAQTAGDSIDSDDTIGAFICLISQEVGGADKWFTLGRAGVWTNGGPT